MLVEVACTSEALPSQPCTAQPTHDVAHWRLSHLIMSSCLPVPRYAQTNRIPPELRESMQEHLRLHFDTQDASDEQVLSIFPTTIRRRILQVGGAVRPMSSNPFELLRSIADRAPLDRSGRQQRGWLGCPCFINTLRYFCPPCSRTTVHAAPCCVHVPPLPLPVVVLRFTTLPTGHSCAVPVHAPPARLLPVPRLPPALPGHAAGLCSSGSVHAG